MAQTDSWQKCGWLDNFYTTDQANPTEKALERAQNIRLGLPSPVGSVTMQLSLFDNRPGSTGTELSHPLLHERRGNWSGKSMGPVWQTDSNQDDANDDDDWKNKDKSIGFPFWL